MNSFLRGPVLMTTPGHMFDARALTRLERVFDLQMWAFGCDARHPRGNLFAVRGMICTPPPLGAAHSSMWRENGSACVVELCSLGVHFTRAGRTLKLHRGALQPQFREQPAELMSDLAKWILEWESWVDEVAGSDWRAYSLSSRTRRAPWNAQELRAEWALMKDN